MDNVLIIGGSGFVGTSLIEACKTEYALVNLDKNPSAFFPELTTIGDVRNTDDLMRIMPGKQTVVLLAAEHIDDVTPTSLYYDVNVQGAQNVLDSMDRFGVKNIVFTSSVAIYGLDKENPDEQHAADPFNHYGKSKLQAEEVLRAWHNEDPEYKSLTIIRPTVIFGERNRGNVYNLLSQIASGKFLMIGKGNNYKSMAYIKNIVAFIQFHLRNNTPGQRVFNYVDTPDLNMNELVQQVEKTLETKILNIRLPYWLGMLGGYGFDIASKVTNKKLPISSVRVKKFCATTQFNAKKAHSCGFHAPYSLSEGLQNTLRYEFVNPKGDEHVFQTE